MEADSTKDDICDTARTQRTAIQDKETRGTRRSARGESLLSARGGAIGKQSKGGRGLRVNASVANPEQFPGRRAIHKGAKASHPVDLIIKYSKHKVCPLLLLLLPFPFPHPSHHCSRHLPLPLLPLLILRQFGTGCRKLLPSFSCLTFPHPSLHTSLVLAPRTSNKRLIR